MEEGRADEGRDRGLGWLQDLVVQSREPAMHMRMVSDECWTEAGEDNYVVGSRPGWVKIRRCEGSPHTPTTVDVLPKEGLRSDRVDVELTIVGGIGVGHLDGSKMENTGNKKSDEGKSEN